MTTPPTPRRATLRRPAARVALAAVAAALAAGCTGGPAAPRETVVLQPGTLALPETVGSHPADHGCPGWSAPSPAPAETAYASADATSTTVQVRVSETPLAAVLLVCLGPTDVVGTVEEIVAAREGADDLPLVGVPVTVLSAYGPAVRTEQSTGRSRLTEWLTEREGHTFAVGHLRPEGQDGHVATVEAMLAGWRWL